MENRSNRRIVSLAGSAGRQQYHFVCSIRLRPCSIALHAVTLPANVVILRFLRGRDGVQDWGSS
jgi:hypothetical protein